MGRVIVIVLVLAGCGAAYDDGLPARDAGIDAARPRVDAAQPADSGSVPMGHMDAGSSVCTATCSSDSVCTSACGLVPGGGIRCCDLATSYCYVSHAAVCPVPNDAAIPGHDFGISRPDTGEDAAVDAACSTSGLTELVISAPGLAGMSVTLQGWNVSAPIALDANGGATVSTWISIGTYQGNLQMLDGVGLPIAFVVSDGTSSATIYPTCIAPDPGTLTVLDRVDVVLQRELSTGLCAGSVTSVVLECVPLSGEYTPSRFDDQPCGPFAH